MAQQTEIIPLVGTLYGILKIWRLSKNAQALVLATTCAVFYIQCYLQFFIERFYYNFIIFA